MQTFKTLKTVQDKKNVFFFAAPHVRVDPQPRTMKPQKPTAAETLRAQNLAPTLRRVRTTRSRSDVFHNSGNESDGEEEADDSPVKRKYPICITLKKK